MSAIRTGRHKLMSSLASTLRYGYMLGYLFPMLRYYIGNVVLYFSIYELESIRPTALRSERWTLIVTKGTVIGGYVALLLDRQFDGPILATISAIKNGRNFHLFPFCPKIISYLIQSADQRKKLIGAQSFGAFDQGSQRLSQLELVVIDIGGTHLIHFRLAKTAF